MRRTMYSSRHGLIEVELSQLWAVQEANAVSEAQNRLAALAQAWADMDTPTQAKQFRLALWDCITVTLADVATGRLWTDRLAALTKSKKTELRKLVEYRAGFVENIPLLLADNLNQTVEELCKQILT